MGTWPAVLRGLVWRQAAAKWSGEGHFIFACCKKGRRLMWGWDVLTSRVLVLQD